MFLIKSRFVLIKDNKILDFFWAVIMKLWKLISWYQPFLMQANTFHEYWHFPTDWVFVFTLYVQVLFFFCPMESFYHNLNELQHYFLLLAQNVLMYPMNMKFHCRLLSLNLMYHMNMKFCCRNLIYIKMKFSQRYGTYGTMDQL